MSVIIFIIALAVLILVHEFGHFIVAKKSGIRVDEFGLGFPPKLWGKKMGETEYTVNAVPFGGFVKIFGEDPHADEISDADRPRSFYYKPKWIQALVLVAGVTMNFLFAWLLISFGFMLGLPSSVGYESLGQVRDAHVVIINTVHGSPADQAGLRSGDTLLFISDGERGLQGDNLTPEHVSELVEKSHGDITLMYRRGEASAQTVIITPDTGIVPGKRAIGIAMDEVGTLKLPPHLALVQGMRTTVSLTKNTAIGLGAFLGNAVTLHADLSQVTGPVGIAGAVHDARDLGFTYLLSLVALISINLTVINLIPFPALDGGRLLFIAIEAIIRRPIAPALVRWTNMVGFALLIILMLVVTGHDIFGLVVK